MGRQSKQKAKDRLDKYYDLAKQQGFRARSAFKLIQLNQKYGFLNRAQSVVDLCAAPGGWLQVCAKLMPVTSTIIGVDLVRIRPITGCRTITGDIYLESTKKEILLGLKKQKVDVVLHDGAPNVGGAWAREAFAQHQLTLQACKLASELLEKGGWFVTKVFRGEDYNSLLWVLQQLFDKVEATKPLASRMESAEIFVACQGFKAPKKIDPKFFKVSEVFADLGEKEAILQPDGTMRAPTTKVPQGFDRMGAQYRCATITDFLACENPKDFLSMYSEIVFDKDNAEHEFYRRNTHSTKEMLFLCKDLAQVSSADQKRMLRWRERLRIARKQYLSTLNASMEIEDVDGQVSGAALTPGIDAEASVMAQPRDEDDEEEILKQLSAIHKARLKEQKKKETKLVDRKLRHLGRILHFDPNSVMDGTDGGDVVKLDHDGKGAELVADDFDEHYDVGFDRDIHGSFDGDLRDASDNDTSDSSEEDEEASDEEAGSNNADERINGESQPPAKKRKGMGKFHTVMEGILDETFPRMALSESEMSKVRSKASKRRHEEETVHLERSSTFQEVLNQHAPTPHSSSSSSNAGSEDDLDSEGGCMPEKEAHLRLGHRGAKASGTNVEHFTAQELIQAQLRGVKTRRVGGSNNMSSFEEVPVASDSIAKMLADPETRARTLALATKMLDKKSRREILEGGIHRYVNHDDGLPDWFVKEEQRHYFRPVPVTREEIDFQKERFKELNLRPCKKVSEAIGRKRRRAQRLLRSVQKKGNTDPKMKEKGERLSVRKLMRSKSLNPIKKVPMDNKMKGERMRQFQQNKKRKR